MLFEGFFDSNVSHGRKWFEEGTDSGVCTKFEIGGEARFRAVLLESSPIAIRGPAGFVRNRYAANLPPAGNLRPVPVQVLLLQLLSRSDQDHSHGSGSLSLCLLLATCVAPSKPEANVVLCPRLETFVECHSIFHCYILKIISTFRKAILNETCDARVTFT